MTEEQTIPKPAQKDVRFRMHGGKNILYLHFKIICISSYFLACIWTDIAFVLVSQHISVIRKAYDTESVENNYPL